MKTPSTFVTILFLAFSFSTFTLFSQQLLEQEIQLDSVYFGYPDDELGIHSSIWKYQYDHQERLISKDYRHYSQMLAHYDEKWNYQYLDNNKLVIATSILKEVGDEVFKKHQKRISRFDDEGLLFEINKFSWNADSSDFIEVEKTIHLYNQSKAKISTRVYLKYPEAAFSLFSLDTIEYNDAGKAVKVLVQHFLNEQLVNYTKTEKDYASGTLLETVIDYDWDTINGAWIYTSKANYIHKEDSIISTYFQWNDFNSSFIKKGRNCLLIDNEGYFTVEVYQSWDNLNEVWENRQKNISVYDYEYEFENIIIPNYHLTGEFVQPPYGLSTPPFKFQVGKTFEFIDGEWVDWLEYLPYYSSFKPLMQPEIKNKQLLKTYPNPAGEFIAIESEQNFTRYTIYSTDGLKTSDGFLDGNRIRTGFLVPGFYMLKLYNTESEIRVAVFIKK